MKAKNYKIKKPGFIVPYIISLLVMLLVFAFLGSLFVAAVYIEYVYEVQEEKENYDYYIRESMAEYYDESDNDVQIFSVTEADISKIKAGVAERYAQTGQRYRIHIGGFDVIDASRTAVVYCVLVDPDNPDATVSHTLRLADNRFLEKFDTEEISRMKCIDSDGLDHFRKSPRFQFNVREFYADFNRGLFIPVEIELCAVTALKTNYSPTGVIVKFDPGNTDGYTHIVTDNKTFRDIVDKKTYIAWGDVIGFEGPDNDADYIISAEETGYSYEATELKAVSFTETNKDLIRNVILIVIWLAAAFAFIPASISYNKKKRIFDSFEYRRKMVDAMAHDLKTPMAAATAYAENLSNHIGTDKQDYYAGKIEENIARMNSMVNSILDFSRSENAGIKISKEDTDIGAVITKVLGENEHIIADRSVKIVYDEKDEIIRTDPELFSQAIANLISNAVLHCKEGSAVEISVSKGKVVITNTIDVDLGDVGKLKEPFVKGRSERGSTGTGLGLAIADNNLAMLGAKLDLKTEDGKFIAAITL